MFDPFTRFADWLAAAQASEPNDPTACALATVDMGADGVARPDVRMVLMKGVSEGGFTFFSNIGSAKGRQLTSAPQAALLFHWKSLRRQIRINGPVALLSDAEVARYFATRPRASQLSAWASDQSAPLDSRATFDARLTETGERYPDAVPRPPHWVGWRLRPERFEFWEDRPGRQHHREQLDRCTDGWTMQLLYP